MSTFETLIEDLTRDVHRVQPKDVLQFSFNFFQQRLEEQRARTRDVLAQRSRSISRDLPTEVYLDTPLSTSSGPSAVSPFSQATPVHRTSLRNSISQHNPSPFGTLNVPGNALLSSNSNNMAQANSGSNKGPPVFTIDGRDLPPASPLGPSNPFGGYQGPLSQSPGDYLHPPTSAIFARRTSVSAESIVLDSSTDEPLPMYAKTPDQLRRIKESIANNFIFRELDEEQETGALNAMQEHKVPKDEVVIRQGDDGEYFYVVESGLLDCYIRPEPLPAAWQSYGSSGPSSNEPVSLIKPEKPGDHPEFGKKVAECKPGNSFGELALMYGHPRAATVLAMEASTLWSLDRITFRTIILKAAHRRRTMYEQFLSSVALLSSLEAPEKSKIADALVSRVYMDGEPVVSQGEMGDTFFFIEEGEATVTKSHRTDDGELREIKVGHLKKGDYFGELSLLRLAPRAATVSGVHREAGSSLPKLKVAALDAPSFTRLLGPLREIMERRAGESYGNNAPRLSVSR